MRRVITSFCAVIMAVIMLGSIGYESLASGTAPLAENLELETYRNVSVGGMLSAFDADDDVTIFEITTYPVKGKIELNDDGSFIYTPAENKKGRDYFGYKAIDSEGNYSQEATVIIRIEKQKSDVVYSDMCGRAEEYSAVMLAENGVFVGEKIGREYCFFPERNVTRAEFLAMSTLVGNQPLMKAVMSTGEEIPQWLEAYVCTNGILGGEIAEEWFEAIEYNEAVAMLDDSIKLTEVSYIDIDGALNDEMAQACVNLNACGIINDSKPYNKNLTRAEASEMLCKALSLINKR